MDWYHRVAVFQKAATLLAGPRRTRNIAAIMLNHSKNPYEAEIDLAELVDFWNFNAYFTRQIYEMQPNQYPGETNRFDWRPLEGFVLAIPPFNFYSIAGNLPTAPAMVGNVALWKPARSVIFSNYEIYKVLVEAGLPPGVDQLRPVPEQGRERPARPPRPRGDPLHGELRHPRARSGSGSARTSRSTATSRGSSGRPAARTSSSCTRPPTSAAPRST